LRRVVLRSSDAAESETDGFTVHTEISIDGGENWFLAAKEEYTPKDG
jgi:hypothetical protein